MGWDRTRRRCCSRIRRLCFLSFVHVSLALKEECGISNSKVIDLASADSDGTLDYDFMIPAKMFIAIELFGVKEIESNRLLQTEDLSRIYHWSPLYIKP